jgi:hypothetical protein
MGKRRGRVLLPTEAIAALDKTLATTRGTQAHRSAKSSAGDILTLLRHHNIPCSIDSFAAIGWTAKLGDPAHGFYAQQSRFRTIGAAATWLLDEARRQYPDLGHSPGSRR